MKRRWMIPLLCLCLAPLAHTSEPPKDIHLVSETWRDYSNADGSGLAWDVLRKVFEPAGVRLRIQREPYTRSIGLVQRGEADAWIGSCRDEVDNVIYSKWHYDDDHIVALGLKGKPAPTLGMFDRYRLVRMHGLRDYQEVWRRGGMLDLGMEQLVAGGDRSSSVGNNLHPF